MASLAVLSSWWSRLANATSPTEALLNGGCLSEAKAWIDFYVTAGASAAVLIGLLFVALSINREEVGAHPHLGGQARQALFALVSIFVLSLIMLIPEQSSDALGAELIAAALVNLGMAVPRQVRRMKATVPTEQRTFALTIAVFDGALLFVVAAGVSLLGDADFALSLLVPAVIAFALLAVFNSWKLTLLGT